MTTLVKGFGIAVRQSREAQGWSQERLAEQSDLNIVGGDSFATLYVNGTLALLRSGPTGSGALW